VTSVPPLTASRAFRNLVAKGKRSFPLLFPAFFVEEEEEDEEEDFLPEELFLVFLVPADLADLLVLLAAFSVAFFLEPIFKRDRTVE